MSTATPRRSLRLPHTHTPKMSERKKSLFIRGVEHEESLTRHRRLSVVDSESDSNDCDLGIISTIDSSSSDENDHHFALTPDRLWRETRSHTKKFQESQDLKHFIKSPFTLKKYQTRYSGMEPECASSASTPPTPRPHRAPSTPSSAHSSASARVSTAGRSRRSLASLIADTESCSSSLKDLNFDTDSGPDSKENTPTHLRRSNRNKTSPRNSFKGILVEREKNAASSVSSSPMRIDQTGSPLKRAVVYLTKINVDSTISPTQMQKTPHNTTDNRASPPKLGHNRRSIVEITESPESTCGSEKSHKRVHYDGMVDGGGAPKLPKMDAPAAPRARLSLFNSDRLKEILSAKSFYGKPNPELNTNISNKISSALEAAHLQKRRRLSGAGRRRREPGQINGGVRHRVRKPRAHRPPPLPKGAAGSARPDAAECKDVSITRHDTALSPEEKADPFGHEKRTIEALLSQWTEDELPESELTLLERTAAEDSGPLPPAAAATPVPAHAHAYEPSAGAVLVEIGGAPGPAGYLLVDDVPGQSVLPDLDEIEREMRRLDEELLQMARDHRLPAAAVLAAVDGPPPPPLATGPHTHYTGDPEESSQAPSAPAALVPPKLFPIFSTPNPGISTTPATPTAKGEGERRVLRGAADQYVIDAGQRALGAVQCPDCGVIYQRGDPQDERDHRLHHDAADVLHFPGWKEECVVGAWGGARALRVRGGAAGWRRVAALLRRVVQPALGLPDLPAADHVYTAYLYIENKQIVGCAVLEPKTRAYKMIPGDPPCCSVEDYPVKCGVARVWTASGARRRGVAARLLECARASLLYGTVLARADVAFSSPTPDGAAFAAAYTGTPNFYVYLD